MLVGPCVISLGTSGGFWEGFNIVVDRQVRPSPSSQLPLTLTSIIETVIHRSSFVVSAAMPALLAVKPSEGSTSSEPSPHPSSNFTKNV